MRCVGGCDASGGPSSHSRFWFLSKNWMVGPGVKKGGREKMRGPAKIIEALCFLEEMRKNPNCELRKEGKCIFIRCLSSPFKGVSL